MALTTRWEPGQVCPWHLRPVGSQVCPWPMALITLSLPGLSMALTPLVHCHRHPGPGVTVIRDPGAFET